MRKHVSCLIVFVLLGVAFLFGTFSFAQDSSQGNDSLAPSQTYLKYLKTNDTSELNEMLTGKKLEQFSQLNMTTEQLALLRKMSFQDQRVTDEKIDGNNATLYVEGTAFKGTSQQIVG